MLDVQARNKELLKNEEQLKQELKLQLEKMEKIRESYAEKSEQVFSLLLVFQTEAVILNFVDPSKLMTLQRMREETDVCVGQLRHEVTSLQVI